jgi:hypothetical protein
MELDFTVRRKRMRVSSEDVIRKLRGVTPSPIRKHAVEVQGVAYPVKQAFAAATGIDLLDFDTNQARHWFQRLGFTVRRVEESGAEQQSGSGRGHGGRRVRG